MLEYKGFRGRVDIDNGESAFTGEVDGIRDVVTFEGRTPDEVAEAFRASVEDYLAMGGAAPVAAGSEPVAWDKDVRVNRARMDHDRAYAEGAGGVKMCLLTDALCAAVAACTASALPPMVTPREGKMSVMALLADWRSYWHTAYSDALTLTGKQTDELCTLLNVPFDGSLPAAAGPTTDTMAEVRENVELARASLVGCFVRCSRCDEQEDMSDCDAVLFIDKALAALASAVPAHPEP